MASSSTALTPEEQAEEDAWAEAWQEADDQQAEEDAWAEAWQEADMEEGGARVVEGMLLQLPHEILCRILSFLSHAALVNTVFRVNVRLSQASAFEARTRTQNRLLEALLSGFGPAADRPRLLTASGCCLWVLAPVPARARPRPAADGCRGGAVPEDGGEGAAEREA